MKKPHYTIRRTRRELRKEIPQKDVNLVLDNDRLFRDITKKLNELKKPQAFLNDRLGISRATLHRLTQGREPKLSTLFKLVAWLETDINNYIKRPPQK